MKSLFCCFSDKPSATQEASTEPDIPSRLSKGSSPAVRVSASSSRLPKPAPPIETNPLGGTLSAPTVGEPTAVSGINLQLVLAEPQLKLPQSKLPPAEVVTQGSLPGIPNSSQHVTSLWDEAIRSLSQKDQDELGLHGQNDLTVLDTILKATEEKRQLCQEKMWKITWKGKEILLRDVADKTITWINKFKLLVDTVVQCDPTHLAIPWAPIRFLLETAVKENQIMGEMLVGIEVITSLLGRCAIYEQLYLGPNSYTAAANGVKSQLESLYLKILNYLIGAKHYYSKNTAARIAGSVVAGPGPIDDLNGIIQQAEQVRADTDLAEVEIQGGRNEELKRLLVEFNMPIVRIEHGLEVLRDGLETTKREKILGWVSQVPYTSHHVTAQGLREEGTCGWVLERPEFREWEISSASSLLRLQGDPGAGKTTLTSMVVDTVLQKLNTPGNQEALAYFYCKRGEVELSDPTEILRSLVRQLSINSNGLDLQTPIITAYQKKMTGNSLDDKFKISECFDLIGELVAMKLQTTIVIDALDECDTSTRHGLLYGLRKLVETSSSLVKIFVSGRGEGDIERAFESDPKIPIMAKDNSKDIGRYVKDEVDRRVKDRRLLNGKIDDELKEQVISKLIEKADGMFLWVQLQIEGLCALRFKNDVAERLGNFPPTLEATYKEIYSRIQSEQGSSFQMARKALMWILCSCRPLSPLELSTMISVSDDEIDTLLEICHTFLKLDKELNVVRFFHLSVEEFFEQALCFTILEANTMAAGYCLSTLINISVKSKDDYPVCHWQTHVQKCSDLPLNHEVWAQLKLFFGSLSTPSKAYVKWSETADNPIFMGFGSRLRYLGFPSRREHTPSDISAFFGFGECIVDLWDEKTLDVNLLKHEDESLLLYAAYGGHTKTVQILLERGAEVNAQSGSALQAAAYRGHEKTVLMLLESGAEVNAQGGEYGNGLQAAVSGGHEKTVLMLLESGAEVNAQGGEYGNALQAAAYRGHEKMVRMLLESGAEANAQGGYYGNALRAAVYGGHEKTVQMLLESGAEVNAQGGGYENALQAAASEGHEKIVQMLLESGAEANAQGGEYENALQAAAYRGHEKIVQMLLESGAEVNAQGGEYENALQAAAYRGHEKIVQMLLESGAEVNAQGGRYGNALQAAASRGRENIVQMLLESGAEVNAQGGEYGNALQAAVSGGHEKTVLMFLESGAEVNAQGGEYGNALQAAACRGHEKMVRMLLESGAEANAQGGYYGNALWAAVYGGHEKTVLMLLESGAEVNAQGGRYGNALQIAVSGGYEKTVQMLLESGAEVNAQGGRYGNALQAAASRGRENIVQMLLESGAEVNAQGGEYGNALQAAVSNDHQNIVQLLLKKGAVRQDQVE